MPKLTDHRSIVPRTPHEEAAIGDVADQITRAPNAQPRTASWIAPQLQIEATRSAQLELAR
jgi:hypothetical protein